MKKHKNILVILAILLVDISISSELASYQFYKDNGIIISCGIDLFFNNLGMTIFSLTAMIIAIMLLIISTMINNK